MVLAAVACSPVEPTGTSAPTASKTSLPDPVSLAPYEPETAFLNHPTLLPEGWELCRHLENVATGDRFCDPMHEEAWLQIAVKDRSLLRLDQAETIEGSTKGLWLEGDRHEAAFPSGSLDVFVIVSSALSDDDLVAVAESIPLVADRGILYADYELPLDLSLVSDEQLTGLLDTLGDPVRLTRRDLEASIFTSFVILQMFGVDRPYVPDLALYLPMPRLVEADRPVVVAESQSPQRSYAIWDQRGYGWRVEGQMTVDEVTTLALDIIEKVAELPSS